MRTEQEKLLKEAKTLDLKPQGRSLTTRKEAILESKGVIIRRTKGGRRKYTKIPSMIPIEDKTALMLMVEQITHQSIEQLLFGGLMLNEIKRRSMGIVDISTLSKWRKNIRAKWKEEENGNDTIRSLRL